jgi:hypothetical protein
VSPVVGLGKFEKKNKSRILEMSMVTDDSACGRVWGVCAASSLAKASTISSFAAVLKYERAGSIITSTASYIAVGGDRRSLAREQMGSSCYRLTG